MKENYKPEFKSSFEDAKIEPASALANTKGGRILVSMDDKGNP